MEPTQEQIEAAMIAMAKAWFDPPTPFETLPDNFKYSFRMAAIAAAPHLQMCLGEPSEDEIGIFQRTLLAHGGMVVARKPVEASLIGFLNHRAEILFEREKKDQRVERVKAILMEALVEGPMPNADSLATAIVAALDAKA